MKAVVGIDLSGNYQPAIDLLKRLDFPNLEVHLLNVVEPVIADGGFPDLPAVHPITMILNDLQEAGKEAVGAAAKEFSGATTQVTMGQAAASLIRSADSHDADLVVVGSKDGSLLDRFISGSVTRALTLDCRRSVLIGKQAVKSSQGLVAVVAHDMSDYCDKALERFVSLAPKGLSRIVLVTADVTDPSIVSVVERIEPSMAGETFDIVHSKLDNHQAGIAEKLRKVCPKVDCVVSQGSADDVIRETMESTGADLLVMGAQGHGFVERLVIGSVALHQTVRERYNVLLMRA